MVIDLSQTILQVVGSLSSLLDSSSVSFLTTIGAQLGGGAVVGFLIGYALKKVARIFVQIAIISIGMASTIVLGVIYGLERFGILTVQVNYGQIAIVTEAAGNWILMEAYSLAPVVQSVITQFTAVTGGFGIGAFLGLKKG
ncbi:MAG: hypothetical protein ACLPY5_06120 [Candidatus Bathyarchaeia archaeon]